MKYSWLLIPIFMMILMDDSSAQRRRMQDMPDRPGPERIERFKKMRLIEVLNLNEEESIRFFAKQNQHEDNVRKLMDLRGNTIDEVEKMVANKVNNKEILKVIDKILDVDQKMFSERKRYQDELKASLNLEQFAKYLIFERDFDRKLRNAMKDMHRGPQQSPTE